MECRLTLRPFLMVHIIAADNASVPTDALLAATKYLNYRWFTFLAKTTNRPSIYIPYSIVK
ncbi:hypothetical protein VCRA2113O325_40376 [Vibrio crassostreae]|uniref:Uncharacterized protein n=1 Tax=Vibrio atlanticus TaxID=693153 RepID=A0ABV4KVX4_9VIBR|nr:hypothetical protein VCRA2113O322_140068 [Vibrio crassostreae]CAK2576318.1 hypothetical protein VCRA2113O323_150065 [Vibrio crassostreae]CAK2979707.1 hypothetical protein VCRA2113O325_40376 [Vibrio crassostreae]